MPLRPDEFYSEAWHRSAAAVRRSPASIRAARQVTLATAARSSATTGCCSRPAPSRSGCRSRAPNLPHVHTLRSLADCRAIIEQAKTARARGRHRRELHRSRGRRLAARARARGARRGAREAADGARARSGARRLRPRAARGARRHLPSRGHGRRRSSASASTLKSGERTARPISSLLGVGVRPRSVLAEKAGLAIDRGVTVNELSGDERARHLRGRRHRALARSALRRAHPRRALGGRRAAGPDGRAQHAGSREAVRRRAVLLEPALRRADQLRRPRVRVGRDRGRRRHR